MAENEKTDIKELKDRRTITPTKILMVFLQKKINGKTFVTEIYFDKKSKETFQDKLFKVIQAKGNCGD